MSIFYWTGFFLDGAGSQLRECKQHSS